MRSMHLVCGSLDANAAASTGDRLVGGGISARRRRPLRDGQKGRVSICCTLDQSQEGWVPGYLSPQEGGWKSREPSLSDEGLGGELLGEWEFALHW